MRSKKTYREYRESESVKFATAAWILDRKGIYVATALVATIACGSFMKAGWDSYHDAIKEPEVFTPYADVQPVSFAGKTWAEKLIATNPAELATWTVDPSSKPRTALDLKVCPKVPPIATSLLSTHSAISEGTEARIQVYGAGQAAKRFGDYVAALNTCFGPTTVETSGNSKFAKFPNGFILTSGDAIIGVSTTNDKVRDSMLAFYLGNVEKSLIESGCLSLAATPEDANRSIFYNAEEYSGLSASTNLEASVDTTGLPTPTNLKLNEIANASATVPEAPLPADFPELPKEAVAKPAIPAPLATQDVFQGVATYTAVDTKGPGCGWEWTAQVAPNLDLQKLEQEKTKAIHTTQASLDSSATNYVNEKINWALQAASLAPSADVWNAFVKQTNLVHEKWAWLESERDKLEPAWRQYVIETDEWMTFDQRKADALKKFDAEFKKCVADEKALSDWEDKWQDIADEQAKEKAKAEADAKKAEADAKKAEEDAKNKPTASPSPSASPSATPSPTPTPSATVNKTVTIPEKPLGCDTPPVEPEIASQDKPAKPQAPVIPKGVTIPASWPTPKTS